MAETLEMLPNTKLRIESSLEDMKTYMEELEDNEEITELIEWTDAKTQVETSEKFLEEIWIVF